MKEQTFFYKFNKNRDIYEAFRHGGFSDDNEDGVDEFSLLELRENSNRIKSIITEIKGESESYFEARKSKKINFLDQHNILSSFREYIQSDKTKIFSLSFGKILKNSEIEEIERIFGVTTVRVSSYDTALEVISEGRDDFLASLSNKIDEETVKVERAISEHIDAPGHRFILKLNGVGIDFTTRGQFDAVAERFNDSTPKNVSLIFSSTVGYSKELSMIRELYRIYKNDTTKVSVPENLPRLIDTHSPIAFSFKNMPASFFEAILTLSDCLLSVEALDVNSWLSSGESISTTEIEIPDRGLSSDINDNIVCVVDNKVLQSPYISQNDVIYGRDYGYDSDEHGTRVASLCMYGRVNTSSVPVPLCRIYNIQSLQNTFSDIEDIFNEAESAGCKIINISQGIQDQYLKDNSNISDLARKIDSALQNRDLLVIISGGNIDPEKISHANFSNEDANINIPKDSISSVVVGAMDDQSRVSLYSRKNNIDPTINIGSVSAKMLRFKDKKKPDFLHYGNNISHNGWYWSYDVGTSYSAPLVTNYAIRLLNNFPKISTNTIKGLLMNYSNNSSFYPSKGGYFGPDIYDRHIGWGHLNKIDGLLNEGQNYINIVIEDYINVNERKIFHIKLPNIREGNSVEIIRSLSYNPPVSSKFTLRYSEFCVSSKLWCKKYQEDMDKIFNESSYPGLSEKEWKESANMKWNDYKNNYGRPLRWLNYFGVNHLWHSNSLKRDTLTKEQYDEFNGEIQVMIQGNARNKTPIQKFAFVMTIDITNVVDTRSFIDSFLEINNDILIHGADIEMVNSNSLLKEDTYIEESSIDVHSIVESFSG